MRGSRKRNGRPRIFLGLVEIADFYAQLQAGFEALGYDAVFVNLVPHPFYPTRWRGDAPAIARLAVAAAWRQSRSSDKSPAVRLFWRLAALSSRLGLLAWALARRDVFIFGFGSSFFGYAELRLLKLCRKRIVYNFHGSDSRPPYLDGAQLEVTGVGDPGALVTLTRALKQRISTIDRFADIVIENPLAGHLHERSVVSALALGIPRRAGPDPLPAAPSERVRVLHSPSNAAAKGSVAIRAAVDRLRARGVPIELVELAGVTNERVLEELQHVDFIVDQLYADTAMAGFAAEAAAAGRPALVGGYGGVEIRAALCGQPMPPVLFVLPDEIEASLERLATEGELRRELGIRARSFIELEWSPSAVAGRFIEAIEGRRPEWIFEPAQIRYLHGAGLSEARARSTVRAVIEEGGVEALCVGDKPALEAELVSFAQAEPKPHAAGSGAEAEAR